MKLSDKLGLGTVQFGLSYGINNISGIPSDEEIVKILTHFNLACTDPLIDTAIAYGNSQERLGVALADSSLRNVRIVSKFAPGVTTRKQVREQLEIALKKLGVKSLYSFMAHNADDLLKNDTVIEELKSAKNEGLIQKIGVSLYFPSQLQFILENQLPVDLIQAPFSVFDQRFSKVFKDAKQSGIEIHTRSAFMQGLIFKPTHFFTGYFAPYARNIQLLKTLSEYINLPISHIALGFCMIQEAIDRVIIGVDHAENLAENLSVSQIFESMSLRDTVLNKISELEEIPEDILLPYNWPK